LTTEQKNQKRQKKRLTVEVKAANIKKLPQPKTAKKRAKEPQKSG